MIDLDPQEIPPLSSTHPLNRVIKKQLRTLLLYQLSPGNEYKQDLFYQSADKIPEFKLNQIKLVQFIYFLCFKSSKS